VSSGELKVRPLTYYITGPIVPSSPSLWRPSLARSNGPFLLYGGVARPLLSFGQTQTNAFSPNPVALFAGL
jgi:hypothetical protein